MTDMHTKLKGHIAAVIEVLRHLDVDSAADLIAQVADEEATGDRSDDAFTDAALDGLRWGHHAAVVVEMGGGALLRVIEPGGVAITSEWSRAEDARPQIKAALAALNAERSICAGVGEASK